MWFRLRVVGNRFASRAQRREMLRTAAVLATILIVYGIVGTMDYADALASEAEAVPVSNRSVISAPPAFSDKHINVQFFSKNSLAMKCQQLNRTRAEHMAGGVMGCYQMDSAAP